MTSEDEHLRARFAELKKQDARTTPSFEAIRSRPRPSAWRVVVPVASLAAAAMLVVWCGAQNLLGTASPQAVAPVAATAAGGEAMPSAALHTRIAFDPAPLDFLLETSGPPRRTSRLDVSSPLEGW